MAMSDKCMHCSLLWQVRIVSQAVPEDYSRHYRNLPQEAMFATQHSVPSSLLMGNLALITALI